MVWKYTYCAMEKLGIKLFLIMDLAAVCWCLQENTLQWESFYFELLGVSSYTFMRFFHVLALEICIIFSLLLMISSNQMTYISYLEKHINYCKFLFPNCHMLSFLWQCLFFRIWYVFRIDISILCGAWMIVLITIVILMTKVSIPAGPSSVSS